MVREEDDDDDELKIQRWVAFCPPTTVYLREAIGHFFGCSPGIAGPCTCLVFLKCKSGFGTVTGTKVRVERTTSFSFVVGRV